jgi:hypothetical protein
VLVELSERGLPRAVLQQRQEQGPDPSTPPVPDPDTWARREVETIGEVWRVDDEWWRQPICRRYIEVVMKGGKHSVLYQDLTTDEWFEQTP